VDDKDTLLQNKLLNVMGREIGSLHAATADVSAVQKDITARDKAGDAKWLEAASETAAQAVEQDFKAWVSFTGAPGRTAASADTSSA
jgi:hypothetical protein